MPMSTRVLRPTVVAFVMLATASFATVAQASAWTTAVTFGTKPAVAQAEAAPSAPASVALDCLSPTQKALKVSWSAVPHAANYDIFYSTTSATAGFLSAGAPVTTTSWTSGTLTNNSYWVQVVANVSANWKSPASAVAGPRVIKNGSVNCA